MEKKEIAEDSAKGSVAKNLAILRNQ